MSVMTAADHRIPKDVADQLVGCRPPMPTAASTRPTAGCAPTSRWAWPRSRASTRSGWSPATPTSWRSAARTTCSTTATARRPSISQEADQKVREMMGGSPHLLRTLIHMDAPDHLKYRAADPGLVPAAEPPAAGGPDPRDRQGRGGQDGRRSADGDVRLRQGGRPALSAARDHEHHGRAARTTSRAC